MRREAEAYQQQIEAARVARNTPDDVERYCPVCGSTVEDEDAFLGEVMQDVAKAEAELFAAWMRMR